MRDAERDGDSGGFRAEVDVPAALAARCTYGSGEVSFARHEQVTSRNGSASALRLHLLVPRRCHLNANRTGCFICRTSCAASGR